MKFKRKFVITAVLTSFLCFTTSMQAFALTYRDVPETHWAYEAISNISAMGFMVGNMSGNFEPNGYVDKFNTVNLLAKMAGYKDSGATAAEQAFQNEAYDTYKSFIEQFSDKFTRWNSSRDREVAFLLHKGILVPDDLNQFIVLSTAGAEQLRALSREELAVFIVRAMGKEQEAHDLGEPSARYADHDRIDEAKRPHVYYLKSLGIITSADNANNFAPKSAATRAAVAYIIDQAMNHPAGSAISQGVATPDNTVNNNVQENSSTTDMINGSISNVFVAVNALQVVSDSEEHNNKIMRIAANAQITVNGENTDISNINAGMTFVAALSGGEIVSIALMTQSQTPEVTQPEVTTPENNTQTAQMPAFFSTVEGRISAVTADTITIDVSLLNLRGEIISESRVYNIANNIRVTRANDTIGISSVEVGDLAVLQFANNTAYTLNLYERDKNFTGTLLSKDIDARTGDVILTVSDSDSEEYRLRVAQNKTQITRRGHGNVSWGDLRIGDTVNVVAEYDVILTIHAEGTTSTFDGTITMIQIEEGNSYLRLRNSSTGAISEHPVIAGSVDLYELRLGSEIRADLDSREVSGVTVIRQAAPGGRTGNVTRVSRTSVTIRENSNSTAMTEIFYNADTVFINAATGQRISMNEVRDGDLLYIVLSKTTPPTAATITVLTE